MKQKKESALRSILKDVVASMKPLCALSWIESHATSIGVPDVSYCCCGREGWIELKSAPDIDVKASQVIWMEERIRAGGWPLFLIQIGDLFLIVPGAWAGDIRHDPSDENILRRATRIWHRERIKDELFKVMRNPEAEYRASSGLILTDASQCGLM